MLPQKKQKMIRDAEKKRVSEQGLQYWPFKFASVEDARRAASVLQRHGYNTDQRGNIVRIPIRGKDTATIWLKVAGIKIVYEGTREQIPAQPVVPVGPITIEQKVAALNDKIALMEKDIANIFGMLGRREQITLTEEECLAKGGVWDAEEQVCRLLKDTGIQEQQMSEEECLARDGIWDPETGICKLPKSARTQESRMERRRRHLGTSR